MRVIAVIWTFNEADFISHTIDHLLGQGIEVQVFDNWSNDQTFDILKSFSRKISFARWPTEEHPCASLTSRLRYLEMFALEQRYDWIINHDADEIRVTANGDRLIDFIERVDYEGFNAIDHTVEVYMPREGWNGTQNPVEWFTERVGNHIDEKSTHIKCWKRQPYKVQLAPYGGHQVGFQNRKVYPIKLILKHYPLRTAAHAERKIEERRQSYDGQELRAGWHVQYKRRWWIK